MENSFFFNLDEFRSSKQNYDFLVANELMNSYGKAIWMLETCYNDDLLRAILIQEAGQQGGSNQSNDATNQTGVDQTDQNNKDTAKKGILQKMWDFLRKLFGVVNDQTQKMSSDQAINEAKKTVDNLEQMKSKEPEMVPLTSQMLDAMKNDQNFREECYKMFVEFEKRSDREESRRDFARKAGTVAALAGGAYLAHQAGLDEKAKEYAKGKADELVQKGKDYVQSAAQDTLRNATAKAQDMMNNATAKAQDMMNDVKTYASDAINQAAENFTQEMSAMKENINKLASQVSQNAKKFISLIIQNSGVAGVIPPNINIDEIVDLVRYDEQGVLHVPIDFRLIDSHASTFLSKQEMSLEQVEQKIKSGDYSGLALENYIKYYIIKCNQLLKQQQSGQFSEYDIPIISWDSFYQEEETPVTPAETPAKENQEPPAAAPKPQQQKQENQNPENDKQKLTATKISISEEQQRKFMTFAANKIAKSNPNMSKEQIKNIAKEFNVFIINSVKNGHPIPKSQSELDEYFKQFEAQKSGGSQIQRYTGDTKQGELSTLKGTMSSMGNQLMKGVSKVAEKGKKTIEAFSLNLDMSQFAFEYRKYIVNFYDQFTNAYKGETIAEFNLPLAQYIGIRESLSRKLAMISNIIGDPNKNNGLIACLNAVSTADANVKDGILSNAARNQLTNIQQYLQWDGNFIKSTIDLFASIDLYLQGIEGVAAKMDELLNQFNDLAAKPAPVQNETGAVSNE